MNFHLYWCIFLNSRLTGKVDTGVFFPFDTTGAIQPFTCFLIILPIFNTKIYQIPVNTNIYQSFDTDN